MSAGGRRDTYPFRAREQELDAVEDVFNGALQQHGGILLVRGEPGIGKTRLIEEAASASSAGLLLLRARCEEFMSGWPATRLAGATRPVPQGGALTPGSGGELSPAGQHRVIEEVIAALEEQSAVAPVVLWLDDAHWAAPAVLSTLQVLGRRVQHFGIGLIVTTRPVARSSFAAAVFESLLRDGAVLVELGPLNESASRRLGVDVLGVDPGGVLDEQLRLAAGNPFFVIESARSIRSDDAEARQSTAGDLSRIRRRFAHFPRDVMDVLRIAAVIGGDIGIRDLARLCDRSDLEVARLVEAAVDAQVLTEDASGAVSFRHDLLRAAFYEEPSTAVKVALHREVAAYLIDSGRPLVEVAPHLTRAATKGDTEAISWLCEAARETASRDLAAAAVLYERALELIDERSETYDQLATELVQVLAWVGRIEEATSRAHAAVLRAVEPVREARARRALAEALVLCDRPAEAREQVAAALRAMAAGQDDRLLEAELLAIDALVTSVFDASEEDRVHRALAYAEAAGSDVSRCVCLINLALRAETKSRVRDFERLSREAVSAGRRAVVDDDRGLTRMYLIYALATHGNALIQVARLEESHDEIAEAVRRCEDAGALGYLATCQHLFGDVCFVRGRWDDAAAAVEAAADILRELGAAVPQAHLRSLARWAVLEGAERKAESLISDLERAIETASDTSADCLRAALSCHRGRPKEAFEIMLSAWKAATSGASWAHGLWTQALIALALINGRRDVAEEVAAVFTAGIAEFAAGLPHADAAASFCRGLLKDDPEVLDESVRLYERSGFVLEAAVAAEFAGAAFIRHALPERGSEVLERAAAIYDSFGPRAHHHRSRVDRENALRSRRRVRAQRVTFGWDALTETELRVASLVASGLSNRRAAEKLFVSRFTVDTHVKHIYSKLGISTRAELALEVAKRLGAPTAQSC